MANLNLPFELQTFTIKEVGILLSAHPNTIRRYLEQKRLEGIKIGEGEIRISGSSVVKMIEEGKTRYAREGNQVGYALTKKGTTAKSKERAKKVLEQVGPMDAVKARAATVLERLGLKS
jgi:DNA-binding transcriptional regulator PaaX